MKLESKHIVPYLPYGLKIRNGNEYDILKGINNGIVYSEYRGNLENMINIEDCTLILRPLSDLNKIKIQIGENYILLSDHLCKSLLYDNSELINKYGILSIKRPKGISNILIAIHNEIVDECPIGIYKLLGRHHFDIYNLIEKGLAIDINTL